MKMKLFKYGYLIRHAFDLGRIFPIIIKQRGIASFITGISTVISETLSSLWAFTGNPHYQYINHFLMKLQAWVNPLSLFSW